MNHRERDRRGLQAAYPILLAAVLLAASAACAQNWTEVGDAGDLVGTAQSTAGNGPLASIAGVLSGHGDVDVYCVQLTAVPPWGLPLASVACAAHADPTPYLFTAAGLGIDANMTCAGGLKEIVVPNVTLSPGLYYLAIAHGDWLPQSAGGGIWQLSYTGHLGPNGPGAGGALTSWTGPTSVTAPIGYTLNLNQGFITYCDGATPVESSSWGALKARFGN